jgi:hypothetical protein
VRYLVSFARFWWDFIVGDDWLVAVGVAITFGLTGLLAHRGLNAWWLLPLTVMGLLAISLYRAARRPR